MKRLMLGIVGLLFCASAFAASPYEVTLEQGNQSTRLGLRVPFFTSTVPNLSAEIAASHWTPSGDIVEFTPTYRLKFWQNYYFDASLGVSLSDHMTVGGRTAGTLFAFTEGVGVGYDFGNNLEVGIGWRHYSNADISTQNPGHEMPYVRVGWRF